MILDDGGDLTNLVHEKFPQYMAGMSKSRAKQNPATGIAILSEYSISHPIKYPAAPSSSYPQQLLRLSEVLVGGEATAFWTLSNSQHFKKAGFWVICGSMRRPPPVLHYHDCL